MPAPTRLLIAGYGDIGARVARLLPAGVAVQAVNRSGRECLGLPQAVTLIRADLAALGKLAAPGSHILWLAPPPAQGPGDATLEAALDGLPAPAKFVYLSTSGVYGDCGGAWVNESRPPAPGTDRARRRLAAERALQAWAEAAGCPWAIARVPGIYGPGRLPLQRLRERRPGPAPTLPGWSNRVHADDLAAALWAILRAGEGIYNVADGSPGTMGDYFRAVAQAAGLPPPPEVDSLAQLPPGLASYLQESRRIDAGRLHRELGWAPQYPDLRAALPGCLAPDLAWQAPQPPQPPPVAT